MGKVKNHNDIARRWRDKDRLNKVGQVQMRRRA